MKAVGVADGRVNGAAGVSRLGLWLAEQLERTGYSTREVEQRSGGLVSRAQVSALTTGRARGLRIDSTTAAGLARVFGVKPDVVRELAGTQLGEKYIPPDEARWLTPAQRRAVDAVIHAFVIES